YAYFGLNLSTRGTPKLPTTITVNGGRASVSRSTRLSATQYRFTIKFTFAVGNDGYAWIWNECSKDVLTKDGIGLPGTHSCGATRVAASTLYLG
ncbi:MAG: hypothetical protein ACRDP7_05305, partial [Trebonia sp.]